MDSKPKMTTIGGRPASVQSAPQSIDGTYVQCRLSSGADVYVPLREIYRQFEKELLAKLPRQ